MTMNSPDKRIEVPIGILREFGIEALASAGLAAEPTELVTEVQLEATIRGQPTHNVGAIAGYAEQVAEGALNNNPGFILVNETSSHALFDADRGPGQWSSVLAMRVCIEKARQSGVSVVGVNNSNHFGAAAYYASMASEADLIGICTTNGGLVLAPWGGATPTFGNNPLGVAIPAAKSHPIMLDIAMSTVAMGKVSLSLAQGKGIPPGWYMDSEGRPTTDPSDYPHGIGVPIAEHKGYGLALLMEVLSGVLTGSKFGIDHEFRGGGGGALDDLGHFFMAIDPSIFMPIEQFKDRVEEMIRQIKSSKLAVGSSGVMVPGEPEWQARDRNLTAGTVPLLEATYETIAAYIDEKGLKTKLPPAPG